MAEIVLVRHGETAWSAAGKHTGRTDVPLTETGEGQARALDPVLAARTFGLVLTSPLQRAARTAELAGLAAQPDEDLMEWDYGRCEGRTTAEIRAELGRPWSVWVDGVVDGEPIEAVAARAGRVVERCVPVLAEGHDVALVSHAHLLRILTAGWLGLAPAGGALLALSAGTWSTLGFEHERRVVTAWNVRP